MILKVFFITKDKLMAKSGTAMVIVAVAVAPAL